MAFKLEDFHLPEKEVWSKNNKIRLLFHANNFNYLVAQNVVAEDLLRHRGDERDGVGHREAHLFRPTLLFKQQSPPRKSHSSGGREGEMVKFLHFLETFSNLGVWEQDRSEAVELMGTD